MSTFFSIDYLMYSSFGFSKGLQFYLLYYTAAPFSSFV